MDNAMTFIDLNRRGLYQAAYAYAQEAETRFFGNHEAVIFADGSRAIDGPRDWDAPNGPRLWPAQWNDGMMTRTRIKAVLDAPAGEEELAAYGECEGRALGEWMADVIDGGRGTVADAIAAAVIATRQGRVPGLIDGYDERADHYAFDADAVEGYAMAEFRGTGIALTDEEARFALAA